LIAGRVSRRRNGDPWYGSRVASPAKAEHGSPVPVDEDGELVERIRSGDTKAMGMVYDRHAPSLLSIAVRMLGAQREAEDLLHDVFLEAWQHAREYDPLKGSLYTWLIVRLRSRALDRLGRAEARRTRSLEDSPQASTLALDGSAKALDGIAVRRALGEVEASVRKVLELTYFDGLTAREIAEQMAVPVGTVKSRLARGLSVLEALLSTKDGVS
jgi:RNA polymerase sigma-70 factor (ECF subfamily)